ncbi:hypothetical protein Zmor_007515 [Zophobas morio]|uniref:Uncharacterized protein n=1 Tax=Zophobas morio TaxID=2755281 RepID=A0AA38IXG2_9CUCU|nr:hypothetical protein Zmor_007515 [Zophobas morio]
MFATLINIPPTPVTLPAGRQVNYVIRKGPPDACLRPLCMCLLLILANGGEKPNFNDAAAKLGLRWAHDSLLRRDKSIVYALNRNFRAAGCFSNSLWLNINDAG